MKTKSGYSALEIGRLAAFSASFYGFDSNSLEFKIETLRGGLRAITVARVQAQPGSRAATRFIVKIASGDEKREADIYCSLANHGGAWLAPRLLATDDTEHGHRYLYLEEVVVWRRWPWKEEQTAREVLKVLAWLHAKLPERSFNDLDYEAELETSAATTVELFERSVRDPHVAPLAQAGRHLRQIVTRLPEIRRALLSNGTTVLHGDVHPGNVLVRRRRGRYEALLIDWARVRIGSPLEDVASWLQSLGYWEPKARRRHDTLLRYYLAARAQSTKLTRDLRELYWIAAACNGLSGALRYHLAVALAPDQSPKRRLAATAAARDWLRIMRRANEI